jgi:hypothetical protein
MDIDELISALLGKWHSQPEPQPAPPIPGASRPHPHDASVVSAPRRTAVARSANNPYGTTQGWRPISGSPSRPNAWRGYFEVHGKKLEGEISTPYPGCFEIFLLHLPPSLSGHPCFIHKGSRWQMHTHYNGQTLDHAILGAEDELEKVL